MIFAHEGAAGDENDPARGRSSLARDLLVDVSVSVGSPNPARLANCERRHVTVADQRVSGGSTYAEVAREFFDSQDVLLVKGLTRPGGFSLFGFHAAPSCRGRGVNESDTATV